MSDLNALMRLRSNYGKFLNQRNIIHRGEIVAFRPNLRSPLFNTDNVGFRLSTLKGRPMSVKQALEAPRFGIVLGSSHIFGLGVEGDQNVLPSLLADRFGFPFANLSLPEGNSRNLFSLLNGYFARTSNAPAVVIHYSGGDFTSYCFGGHADSVFGSPNLKQIGNASKVVDSYPPAETTFPAVRSFTTLWTRMIVQLCRARQVPVILGQDTTFFEKSSPSEFERTVKLGSPFNPLQKRWFPVHRRYFPEFLARRREIAKNQHVPLVGDEIQNALTFIDEFHYDEAGMITIADHLAPTIEELISAPR